jgi:hypothetical protein
LQRRKLQLQPRNPRFKLRRHGMAFASSGVSRLLRFFRICHGHHSNACSALGSRKSLRGVARDWLA